MTALANHFLIPLSPILSLVSVACCLIGMEWTSSQKLHQTKRILAYAGVVGSFLLVAWLSRLGPISPVLDGVPSPVWLTEFAKHYRFDLGTLALYGGLSIFTLMALLLTDEWTFSVLAGANSALAKVKPEAISTSSVNDIRILVLFVATGMMLLVSAESLLMVFVALELMSLPTYVLVGIQRRDIRSCEGALKYYLFGSLGSAFLVLGIALLYSQLGTLEIRSIGEKLRQISSNGNAGAAAWVSPGLALILIATLFKAGAVPFHMWLPDAYQGAPTPVTAFMGSAVKLATFGLLIRLLWDGFSAISTSWVPVLNWVAVATMFVGNLAALVQNNIKRLLAYSSIAHAGYLLLGVSAVTPHSTLNPMAVYYYLLMYGFMFIGMFVVLGFTSEWGRDTRVDHFSGLGFRHPILGVCTTILLLSLTGIPPTAGFLAKYLVFFDAVRAGNTFFVVLGVVSSLIGAYYYLKIIVYMYMKDEHAALIQLPVSPVLVLLLFICTFSVIYFGIVPVSVG